MSGFTTVQTLLDEAKDKRRKLTTEERRRVIAFLLSSQPDLSNVEMGTWFQVTEGCIRKDRSTIRKQMANDVKEDDIGMVIADLVWSAKRQIADLETSKAKANKGSMAFVQHCKAVIEIQQNTVKSLQTLGFYPKNLGNLSIDKFEYAAIVSADGSVETRPMNLFDDKAQEELRDRARKSLPAAPVIVDAEFVEDRKVEFAPAATEQTNAPENPSRELPQNVASSPAGDQN